MGVMQESGLALALTLGAALGWSVFDSCRKALAPKIAPVPLTAVFSWAQAPIFLVWAWWAASWNIQSGYMWPALGVLVFNVTACLLFFEALRRSALSVTIPILAFVPVFAAVGGWVLLDEGLSIRQWMAIALVGLGALFLNAKVDDLRSPLRLLAALRKESGSVLMVGVALCWAATSVFDKLAMKFASAEIHAGVQLLIMAILLTGWLASRGRSSEILKVRAHPVLFLGGVVVAIIALSFQLYAIQIMYVGLMEGIKRACGIVFAIVLGRLLFDEEVTVGKIVAGCFMVAGVYLLG